MSNNYPVLGEITAEQFLAEYWQKKPLLIRQAIPDFESFISAEELAGIACEESAESRIIIEHGKEPWQTMHGPFSDNDFRQLPENSWTLLVQAMDHWVPEINQLIDQFRFIPNWRIDDVMASYAPRGGSVGPHFDHYDVFLLQAHGQRHWQVGQVCDQNSSLLNHQQLKILNEFNCNESWVLEPGDMLYLPPKYAHHGVAKNDCITYSIGFRAPTTQELLLNYTGELADSLADEDRYQDPDLQLQENPGEISSTAISRIQDELLSIIGDEVQLSEWFGRYMTEPKYDEAIENDALSNKEIQHFIDNGMSICWQEGARYAYHINTNNELKLFVDGKSYKVEPSCVEIVKCLCQQSTCHHANIVTCYNNAAALTLLAKLYQQGSLYFEEM